MTDAMTARGLLSWESGPALTASGAAWLPGLGITYGAAGAAGRPHVRTCLDWTEQRPHLAGAVAAALFHRALEASWLVPGDGSRVVRLTEQGRDAFRRHLGLADEVLTTR
jgi:hypothetical protein